MKVHLFARLAVRGRLGRGEGGKDLERRVADGRRQSRFLQQETDSLPITRRLLAGWLDDNPRAADGAAAGRSRRDTDALDAESRDGVLDRRQRQHQRRAGRRGSCLHWRPKGSKTAIRDK